jgi:serine protease
MTTNQRATQMSRRASRCSFLTVRSAAALAFGLALILSSAAVPASAAAPESGSTREGARGDGDGGRGRASTPAPSTDDVAFHVDGEIVVDFADGTTKAQFDELEKAWGIDLELADDEEGVDSAITVGQFEGDDDDEASLLEKIRREPRVETAEPLMRYSASFVPNDPLFERQWNLKMIHMPDAWEVSRGKGVIVAVLDTGIAWEDRSDFRQAVDLRGVKFVPGFDFVNLDPNADDDHGHGTHVAGTIAQATNNGVGVAGIAFEASLMPVKVLDHFGSGTSARLADAIRWAADHGAKVLNLSLGGGGRSEIVGRAVAYARARGAVVVCASGNTGRGSVEFPAAYPGSVAVGAVGPNGAPAPYSAWGLELDLVAPGGDKSQGELGGVLQNGLDPVDPSKSVYLSLQGTSMATPHVSGVAALLFAAGANGPDEVEAALFESATQAKEIPGWAEKAGRGLLDARGALLALKAARGAQGSATPAPVHQGEALAGGSNGRALSGAVSLDVEAPSEGTALSDAAAPSQAATATASAAEADWRHPTRWSPLAWAAVLLAFVLLTLGRRERPGYLNLAATPSFFLPLVLATVGAFVLALLKSPNELVAQAALPLPEWLNRIIFGRGAVAHPLVYSAALPVVASLFAVRMKALRLLVAGLAFGFAGILCYSAWAGSPPLAWLPLRLFALPWLVSNALVCLFVARAMIKKETP